MPNYDRGTFGDMFGGLNTFFSGLAFAGIVYAILLQREDLIETRKEVKGQSKRFREQTTASIILELTKTYSTDEMNEAVYYLKKLRQENEKEFEENKYTFARKYLSTIKPDSREWNMRRMVSSFYGDMAVLIESEIVDDDAIFLSYGPQDISIIEFLEPIETVIKAKYYELKPNTEYIPARLLDKARKWQIERSEKLKTEEQFTIPLDKEKYSESLKSKETKL